MTRVRSRIAPPRNVRMSGDNFLRVHSQRHRNKNVSSRRTGKIPDLKIRVLPNRSGKMRGQRQPISRRCSRPPARNFPPRNVRSSSRAAQIVFKNGGADLSGGLDAAGQVVAGSPMPASPAKFFAARQTPSIFGRRADKPAKNFSKMFSSAAGTGKLRPCESF